MNQNLIEPTLLKLKNQLLMQDEFLFYVCHRINFFLTINAAIMCKHLRIEYLLVYCANNKNKKKKTGNELWQKIDAIYYLCSLRNLGSMTI